MLNRLNALIEIARRMYCTRFGYVVCVPEYNGLHYCTSLAEFHEWRMQYPMDTEQYFIIRGQRAMWRDHGH